MILLILVFYLPMIMILCYFFSYRCKECTNKKCTYDPKQLTEWMITATTEYVFNKLLKKEAENGEKVKPVYKVCGFKAPCWYRYWLFVMLYQLFGVEWLEFWENFPLLKSYACTSNPILSCFSSNASASDLPLDCSNTTYLEYLNITSFICYKFTYDIGKAAGPAVGIFTTAGTCVAIITFIVLKASDQIKNCYSCCKVVIIITQLL